MPAWVTLPFVFGNLQIDIPTYFWVPKKDETGCREQVVTFWATFRQLKGSFLKVSKFQNDFINSFWNLLTFFQEFKNSAYKITAWGILPFVLCFGNLQVDIWWVSLFLLQFSDYLIIWLLFFFHFKLEWTKQWKLRKSFFSRLCI